MRALAVSCVLLAACLDFNGARDRCRDAGRCDGAAGGSVDTDGGAGGTGGTGGSGGSAGGVAPMPCAGTSRPRLSCGPRRVLASGGSYSKPALSESSDGLFAAWVDGRQVHAMAVSFDGGTRTLVDEAAPAQVTWVTLRSERDAWALLYMTGENQPLRCFSSGDDAGVSVTPADSYVAGTVAVSETGAVAVMRGGQYFLWAISPSGCPSSLARVSPVAPPFFLDAIHIPGTGPEGFRFTTSGYDDPYTSGGTAILGPTADGGLQQSPVYHPEGGPMEHRAHLSANKSLVLIAYRSDTAPTATHLRLRSLPVDLVTLPNVSSAFLIDDPYSFAVSGCGPDCMATAWTANTSPTPVSVFFTDEGVVPALRGPGAFDVVCDETETTEAAVAFINGQLQVLIAEPSPSVSLVACDIPAE